MPIEIFAEENNTNEHKILEEFSKSFSQNQSFEFENTEQSDMKEITIENDVKINEEFTSDTIIVYIKKNYSNKKQVYTIDDFPYLNLSNVKTIFKYSKEKNNRIGLCLFLEKQSKQNVIDAIALLQQDEKVYFASPNYIMQIVHDEEKLTSRSTHYLSDERSSVINCGICCARKYTSNETTYNTPAKVGIIDAGIYNNSISGMYANNPSINNCLTSINSKVVEYKDFTNTNTTCPVTLHGTNMASIISKGTDEYAELHSECSNNIYQGVCPNVQLYSFNIEYSTDINQAKNNSYMTTYLYICNAIEYAETKNIKILNMSISYVCSNSSIYTALQNAVSSYSGIIVCGAGNDALSIESSTNVFPRDFNLSQIIVVGASQYSAASGIGSKTNISNFGQSKVDLFAYDYAYVFDSDYIQNGTYVTIKEDSIIRYTREGTSNASARVAGAAAVLLNIKPDLTAAQLRHYILAGVDKYSSLTNYCVTGGTLDVYRSAKMLIADLACDSKTIFAGHFTDVNNMQVAAYVPVSDTMIKCFVWTYNSVTGEFSDPELWFADDGFGLDSSGYNNMYRSVAGNFYGDDKDEICTLYNSSGSMNYLYFHDSSGIKYANCDINLLQCTGRVTCGNYDEDVYDEIAGFYQMSGAWAHTKLYVWDINLNNSGYISTTPVVVYDSGAGVYAAEYATDRVVSGNFDSDSQEEIAVLYRYSGSGNYCLHKFDINIAGQSVTYTAPIFNSSEVDVSKANGRVVTCDYDGGMDEIVCLYDNTDVATDSMITYGFKINSSTWELEPLHTSYQYNAGLSKYLVVSGAFNKTLATGSTDDYLDDVVTFYKLPALNSDNIRGRIYMTEAPDMNGYALKWDAKA